MDVRKFLHDELKAAGYRRKGSVAYIVGEEFTGVVDIVKSRKSNGFIVHCGIVESIDKFTARDVTNYYLYTQINKYGVPNHVALLDALDPDVEMSDDRRKKILSDSIQNVICQMKEKWLDLEWIREYVQTRKGPVFTVLLTLKRRLGLVGENGVSGNPES